MPVPAACLWTLPNGLRVAFERRAGPGFAFDLRLPVGSAHDPPGLEGSGGVLEEWLFKGAAGRDARQLQDAFDDLGVRRGGGVGPEATRISVSGLSEDFGAALRLVGDVLLRPLLPPAEVAVLLDLARQDLEGLQDSPADLLLLGARAASFPRGARDDGTGYSHAGYGHPVSGTPAGLESITPVSLWEHYGQVGPRGALLGVVADLEAQELRALLAEVFGEWSGGKDVPVPAHFQGGQRLHFPLEGAEQTHLNLLSCGVAPGQADWLTWQLALTALCGGSSSRLFHVLREERGLVYSVSAGSLILAGQGFLNVYAASTPERLPETLEVVQDELRRLSVGLSEAEFRRALAGLSASVVFGGESGRSRAHAMTRDLALFGRVRDLPGLREELGRLTLAGVNAFLAGYEPLRDANVFTLGEEVQA